jgi:NifU-like protein involved in Fe-S cluster formation
VSSHAHRPGHHPELAQAAQAIQDPRVKAAAAQELGMSEAFLEHALTPQNLGALPRPDGYGRSKGSCGDVLELYLKVEDERVADARFMPQGCAHTVACGSALTTLIKGRPLGEAAQVDAEAIENELGGLPRDHRHCAVLAATTLRSALRDYYQRRRQPWKKDYDCR